MSKYLIAAAFLVVIGGTAPAEAAVLSGHPDKLAAAPLREEVASKSKKPRHASTHPSKPRHAAKTRKPRHKSAKPRKPRVN
jgi:hypothetical protein